MKYLLIIIFFSISCTSEKFNVPKDILSEEKMIAVYTDIHISDALVSARNEKDIKKSNQLKKSYLVDVLKKHNISLSEYEKSNLFYEDHPTEMYEMYEEILINFSKIIIELEGEKVDIEKTN